MPTHHYVRPEGNLLNELERVKGIEPSSKAWEAFVLPLNYTRASPILRQATEIESEWAVPLVLELWGSFALPWDCDCMLAFMLPNSRDIFK